MKRLLSITICLVLFFVSASSLVVAQEQAWSGHSANSGEIGTFVWSWGTSVPVRRFLDIYSATLTYFPAEGGTIVKVGLDGRDVNGNAVWRLQAIYLEPQKTMHMTFPNGLRLPTGGHVEIFCSEGTGSVYVDLNGRLNKK